MGVPSPAGNRVKIPAMTRISAYRPLFLKKLGNLRIPIRVKLSLAITFVIWLTILILSFSILARQRDQLYSQAVKMGKISLNYFATNANIPLLNDDILRLNRLIKDALTVDGILYAAIVDRQNTIKAHIDPNNIGMTLEKFQSKQVSKDENVTYFRYNLPSGTPVLNLSRPVTLRDKELGTVHVGLSLEFINDVIYWESLSIVLLSFLIVLLGIAIAVVLGISFSRPISRLAGATREIGKGNLQYRIAMDRKDEFGDLASAFNHMADELDKKVSANIRLFAARIQAEKEARELEEQLRQSQKMEAVGQLAGGIAHDFNNSLTLIKVCSQLALQEIKKEDPVREKLLQIDEATKRSGDLARQLLTFSRREIVEMKVLDLNQVLTNLNKMLRRVIGEDIEFTTRLAGSLGRIKADPGQIEQIIVNLTVNARDAMPGGGKLVLETANVILDEEYARTHVHVTTGPYVLLSVRDTGTGMTPEVKEHIFEPFFTTKEEGKGTGLGLFMVYGIVQKYDGHIVVESGPEGDTAFHIYFPQANEGVEAAREEIPEKKIPRGGETVLVVEDDENLRRLIAEALKQQGYKTLEAANGGEGLLVFDKNRQEIGLIVTDIVMPVMNGFELTDLIKPVSPQTKAIYISGYPENPALQKRSLNPDANFLQKPFSSEDLAIKVRRILDN